MLPPSGGHHTARRVDLLDGRLDEFDSLSRHALKGAPNLLGSALPDRQPEE